MTSTVPVTILAGQARSGKSSFLAHLQKHGMQGRSAIVGKELSRHPDALAQVLHQMKLERQNGAADFERVIVECDAEASPARPALGLLVDEAVAGYYRLDAIVTVVDALHGHNHLALRDMALTQVVLADRLLMSKCDLVLHDVVDALHQRLHQLNPRAAVQAMHMGRADLAHVFDTGAFDLGVMLALEPRFFHQPPRARSVAAALPAPARCGAAARRPGGLHH